MMNQITISQLQKHIAKQDYNPELKQGYFLKLAEEINELSRAMRKNIIPTAETEFKGAIVEELYDIIYYALAIANCYNVDIGKWIYVKEKFNDDKNKKKHADKLLRKDTWDVFDKLVDGIDEKLNPEDFPRCDFERPLINFGEV